MSDLLSIIPTSVFSALTDPAAAASLSSAFAAGSTPAWFSSLPASDKSWLSSYQSQIAELGPTIWSLETAAGITSGPYPGPTADTNAAVTGSKGGATAAASKTSAGSAQSGATSTGGGVKQTGALAMGVAGAIGVLGLAVAL